MITIERDMVTQHHHTTQNIQNLDSTNGKLAPKRQNTWRLRTRRSFIFPPSFSFHSSHQYLHRALVSPTRIKNISSSYRHIRHLRSLLALNRPKNLDLITSHSRMSHPHSITGQVSCRCNVPHRLAFPLLCAPSPLNDGCPASS